MKEFHIALMRAIELSPNALVANELSRWLGAGEIEALQEDAPDGDNRLASE